LPLMRVYVFHPQTNFEVRRPWHSEDMAHDVYLLVTLIFDLWTMKLVCNVARVIGVPSCQFW